MESLSGGVSKPLIHSIKLIPLTGYSLTTDFLIMCIRKIKYQRFRQLTTIRLISCPDILLLRVFVDFLFEMRTN